LVAQARPSQPVIDSWGVEISGCDKVVIGCSKEFYKLPK
jgi:hypothetical protein